MSDNVLSVDMHGVKHEDVSDKLIRIIEEHRGEPTMLRITVGNSSKMYRLVCEILDDYGYKTYSLIPSEITTWIK